MSTLQIKLPDMRVNDICVPGATIPLRVIHALHTVNNGIIYYERYTFGNEAQWARVSETGFPYNSIIVSLDPITALMRGLATAEEIGLPAGLEGLVALAKAVQNG